MKSLSPQSTFFFDILIDLKSHKVTQSVPGNVATALNSIFADLPGNGLLFRDTYAVVVGLDFLYIYMCTQHEKSYFHHSGRCLVQGKNETMNFLRQVGDLFDALCGAVS